MSEFDEYMKSRQEGRNYFIGPSGAKNCYRQHAYRYFEVEPTDEVSTDAADFGTLIHLGWSEMIRRQFDPMERAPDVVVQAQGMPRPGEADDVDFANRIVTDLKTVSGKVAQSWLNHGGPYDSYWDQLELYALGLAQEFGGEWTLRVVAFNVESRTREEYTKPADPVRAQMLVNRVSVRHDALLGAVQAGGSPEDFPREGNGPGSFPCDWCPFMSACWGDGGPSDPDRTVMSESISEDSAQIGAYIADYLAASAEESKAKTAKDQAGGFLKGLVGDYPLPDGSTGRVSLVGGKLKDPEPDCEAMQARLLELGEEVPMKFGARTARYTRVIRLKRKKD